MALGCELKITNGRLSSIMHTASYAGMAMHQINID